MSTPVINFVATLFNLDLQAAEEMLLTNPEFRVQP
jgi:hypothetical protein